MSAATALNPLWGAILGNIIGAPYERRSIRRVDFPLFSDESKISDDTYLTLATADALLNGRPFAHCYYQYGRDYPDAPYGGYFRYWVNCSSPDNIAPSYESFGAGAAMRVSPVAFAFDNIESVLANAEQSALCTHSHPEGLRSARAVAAAVFLARVGHTKGDIREFLEDRFGYDLFATTADLRRGMMRTDESRVLIPAALIAFFESTNFEDAVRLAVSLGSAADTLATIAGAVAIAYYKKIPDELAANVRGYLPAPLLRVADAFGARYPLFVG